MAVYLVVTCFIHLFFVDVRSISLRLINEILANIYLNKVNYRNTIKRREICLESTIKTPERRVDFEQVNVYWDNFYFHAIISALCGNFQKFLSVYSNF